VSAVVILLVQTYPAMKIRVPNALPMAFVIGLVFVIIVGAMFMALITVLHLILCNVIAKLIFGASGKFIEVMRPLLLGWFVNYLVLIPGVGILLTGIGWTAVLMMVFEEIDGIGRLQAFGISARINLCFFAIQFAMTPVTHHL
jgi:hypothetical protein